MKMTENKQATAVTTPSPLEELEEGEIPPPLPLSRNTTELEEVDPEVVLRYLQYECGYRSCKYQTPRPTWGELIVQDYPHFVELMANDVPADSLGFLALMSHVKSQDQLRVRTATKSRDTPEGKQATFNEFLGFTCTHRGRMNGKTWREVRDKDYSYFTWVVANTMNRDTKSFKVFRDCLQEKERSLIDAAEKGAVQVPRGLKWPKGVL
jgi:hypothetical protein